jgi:pimeloyl-ACP methyl ester carboxylesterase
MQQSVGIATVSDAIFDHLDMTWGERRLPWIEANGVSIHYKLEGKTGPTVILLHEIGGSLDSWDGIVPDLAKTMRVFRYDQRGFGLSEKVRAPYSIETLVDDMQALISALDLQPPFHVVSLAASSMQALEFQARSRAKVGSLVFCNPAPGVDPARAGALENVAAMAEKDGIRGILPTMLDKSYPPSLSDEATYENYRGRYVANDPVGFGLAFRMMARTNMTSLLAGITCPTLVIAGRQDFIRAVSVTEGIAKQIPGARFETIDAGHFMPTTSPGALLALLKDFWKV